LNNAVNKVRRALGDSATAPSYIETVGRRGYRFIARIEADVRTPAPDRLGWAPARAPSVASLAVLPLANLSGEEQEDYFCDGMTDALISQLAGIRSLRVISRQSIVRYKGSGSAMPKIAEELGVDAVIEGSVLRAGGRVRVSVQLVHGAQDRHLWTGQWERELRDVLVVQSEIARAVAEAITATVTADEASRLARASDVNPAAYLKGRFFWRQRTREGLVRSVEYYRTAIAIDPRFALAHAAMAESYGPLGYLGFLPPDEATPAMRAAATRALEHDADLVEALTALAACESFHEWRWREGEEHFRRAIAVKPNYSTAYLWYGLMLEIEGRFDESLAARTRGLELDPLFLRAQTEFGWGLFQAGNTDAGMAVLRGVLELDARYFFAQRALGIIAVVNGRHADAIAAFETVVERGSLAHALGMAGRTSDARAVLQVLEEESSRRYVSPVQHALAHLGLGELDAALSALERALTARAIDLAAVRVDPRFSSIRGEPRFGSVIERMNLARPN
jgi:TolB-like protein